VNSKKPLKIDTETLLTAINSSSYSDQVIASGGSNKFIYTAVGLPKNLFINEDTGIISGIVNTDVGDYDVTITVTDKDFPEKQTTKTILLPVYTGMNIKTDGVIDARLNSNYISSIIVEGGSGDFTYTAVNLPNGLQINPATGEITGTVSDAINTYNFTVTLTDNVTKQKIEKNYKISVVEFYPDTYEPQNDNTIDTTTNIIKPGEYQDHNFNTLTDVDYLKFDLSSVQPDHVVKIETIQLTTSTDTSLSLYSSQKNVITSNNNNGDSKYSCINFILKNQDIYYLKVENAGGHVGDYQIKITDTGPRIEITTNILKDALKNSPYSAQISVTGGSENYKYSISNQPGNLTLSQEGVLSGNITAIPASYFFSIRVDDTTYDGIFCENTYTLNVVDFLPDQYESDDSFSTSKHINLDETQQHTFNVRGDKDFLIMDLTSIQPGDLIKIETNKLTQDTDTLITLFDKDQSQVAADNDSGDSKYSKILFQIFTPDLYFLLCQEMMGNVGDYIISYTNTGAPVTIDQGFIPDALAGAVYTQQVIVKGGSGHYTYTAEGLPIGLNVDENGVISGSPIYPGAYDITFSAFDLVNPENYLTQSISLNVVEFLSDVYETDNNFSSSKNIAIGETQNRNFNISGDVDFIACDLSGIVPGDVVVFKTLKLTKQTDTSLTLYNPAFTAVANDDNSGGDQYSDMAYTCLIPGTYYIKVENVTGGVGDYALRVINSGQKLSINTPLLPDVDQSSVYSYMIPVSGGSGGYTFSINSGSLPTGLALNSSTGQIYGALDGLSRNYSFNLFVRDNQNPENNANRNINVTTFKGVKIVSTQLNNSLLQRPNAKSAESNNYIVESGGAGESSYDHVKCDQSFNGVFNIGELVDIYEKPRGTMPGIDRGVRKITNIVPVEGFIKVDDFLQRTTYYNIYFSSPITLRRSFVIFDGRSSYCSVKISTVLERMYIDTIYPDVQGRMTDRVQFVLKFPNGRSQSTTLYPCYYDGDTRIDLNPINIQSASSSDVFVQTYDLPYPGSWRVGIAQEPEWTPDPEVGKCVVTMYGSSF
jgi:hypothetical protein